jgi:rubrerythrin
MINDEVHEIIEIKSDLEPIEEETAAALKEMLESLCPVCGETTYKSGRCTTCPSCGWSTCSI